MNQKCRLCGTWTNNLGTKLCDGCWELTVRIERAPEIALKILAGEGYLLVGKCEVEDRRCGNDRRVMLGRRIYDRRPYGTIGRGYNAAQMPYHELDRRQGEERRQK